ncbi:branched-chain amino acid ABC transporter permease [Compostimonas suwonensis]|uniref:Branched-chain amino acid transport system permease protein n=1 Tax=Compostimonas suwonensis TaxID=1048394 RepID=A0A2M9BCC7_9MICO|nr:branched-chain amino acid ABC transporter permease [Compostimonas suwonensis]PJJ55608.1 branched-chain amino acid transport system permease protein [Compostimonas suwonensis]
MNTALQLIIAGLAVGSIYGLIALGFLIIHHATGIVNFAQGNMLMVGAVTSYLVVSQFGLSYFVAIPVVVVVAVLVALVFDHGLVRPLQRRGAPVYSIVVGTLVFGIILAELAALIAGDQQRGVPPLVPNDPISLAGLSVRPQTLLSVLVAWAIVVGVWFFFNRTLSGLSLKAVGLNRTGAEVTGIRVPRMLTIAFIVSIVITCIGGLLIAPILGAGPRMGLELGVKGFAAAVLGGFDSVNKAMIAGVALGILETLTAYYLSSAYASAIAYAVLLVALCIQPLRVQIMSRRTA